MPQDSPIQTLLLKQAGQTLSLLDDVQVFDALAAVVGKAPQNRGKAHAARDASVGIERRW